jgi:Mn2+/Fe2+ NRAMP family transporter
MGRLRRSVFISEFSPCKLIKARLILCVDLTPSFNLIRSQFVLCIESPFAMFPLLLFAGFSKRMEKWRSGRFLLFAGWGSATLITAMDIYSLPDSLRQVWTIIVGH